MIGASAVDIWTARASVAIEPPGRPAIAWGRAIVDLGGAGVRNSRATARTGARIALGADGLAARRGRHRADRERDRRDDEGRTRTNGERDGRHLLGDLDGADGGLGGHLHGAGGASLGGAGRGGNLDGGDGGNLGDGHFEVGVVLMCYETCVRMARDTTLPASSRSGSGSARWPQQITLHPVS